MSNAKYRIYLCSGPHCSTKGLTKLRNHLDYVLWRCGLTTTVEVQMSGCQDHCDYGPNLIIWPGPYRYAGMIPSTITRIVEEHLRDGAPVQSLLATPDMRR